MIRNLIIQLVILFFVQTFSYSQEIVKKQLEVGEILEVNSVALNEKRNLNIMLPLGYSKDKEYPVVFLLDGSLHEDFFHIAGLIQFFNLQFKMPATIVVGIENVDRKRDFTSPTSNEELKQSVPTSGKSELFIHFIGEEVIPLIADNYNISSQRYIIGQSLGGLLACEILLKKPDLFSHYFIVSPSLWWDDQHLLKELPQFLTQHKELNKNIYLSVGKDEHPIMVKDAKNFYKLLLKNEYPKGQIVFNSMKNENHATIFHNSIYEGLLHYFPYSE